MAPAPVHPPSSFYIILIDHSAPQVEIPRDFVRKHLKDKIPKDPIIRSTNEGYSWQLKIKKFGENYCFAQGWNNVVKDINLSFGDFLLFRLVDQSTFKMHVFSPNGSEKKLPPKINIDVDDDDDDDTEDVVDDVTEDVDDDDDDVEDDNNDMDSEDDDEFDDDDDDNDDDDDDNDDVVDDDDDDDDDDDEDDVDGDIDGNDGDPFFTTTITKTHKTMMRLKPTFMRLAGIDGERVITVKNLDEEEWSIDLRFDKSSNRYYFSSGWRKFVGDNDLSEDDKCVFKFITNEDKLFLAKVTKKRPTRRQPRRVIPAKEDPVEHGGAGDDLESEDECVKVVKRSRGRPHRQLRGRTK